MGNAHAYRRRLAPALILLVVLTLVAVAFAGIAAQKAQALPTFTQAVNGIGPCSTCHSGSYPSGVHAVSQHSGFITTCATCHPSGDTSKPPLPSACAACHGGTTAILAKTTHAATKCGTTPGCHGVPSPSPSATAVSTTLAAKVAPTSVKVGKSVKVTGTAGPAASLAGAKVAFKVERKVGAKWTKMKTGSATASATGAFTWSYKAAKKGAHRVTASITGTSAYTAKSVVKTFKVK
jgi:hypothetical protein